MHMPNCAHRDTHVSSRPGREGDAPPRGVRIPCNEDCLRWRPPRHRDGKPLSHTWKCCLHSRMDARKGHDYTSCSGALQCDVMWVMHIFAQRGYHKMAHMAPCTACTIKKSQTLLQVQENDQSSLPMSLVASLDTVPVTCCVPLQEKIDKWARNCPTCQGSN